jgi:hypothetical protein
MGRFKDLAIALRNGDALTSVERDYISTLSPQEYGQCRGHDNSYGEYRDQQYWAERERQERLKNVSSQQQNNQQPKQS